jgi:hypothetical protein
LRIAGFSFIGAPPHRTASVTLAHKNSAAPGCPNSRPRDRHCMQEAKPRSKPYSIADSGGLSADPADRLEVADTPLPATASRIVLALAHIRTPPSQARDKQRADKVLDGIPREPARAALALSVVWRIGRLAGSQTQGMGDNLPESRVRRSIVVFAIRDGICEDGTPMCFRETRDTQKNQELVDKIYNAYAVSALSVITN